LVEGGIIVVALAALDDRSDHAQQFKRNREADPGGSASGDLVFTA
jgi:hypothetical protein